MKSVDARQFTDEFNAMVSSPNGLTGVVPAYFATDVSARDVIAPMNATLSLSVKNMFDKRYFTPRRPAGIKVGMPRFICAGIDFGIWRRPPHGWLASEIGKTSVSLAFFHIRCYTPADSCPVVSPAIEPSPGPSSSVVEPTPTTPGCDLKVN